MLQESLQNNASTEMTVQVSAVLVQDLILCIRRLNVKEIAQKWTLSDTQVRQIIHIHLGMNKVGE